MIARVKFGRMRRAMKPDNIVMSFILVYGAKNVLILGGYHAVRERYK